MLKRQTHLYLLKELSKLNGLVAECIEDGEDFLQILPCLFIQHTFFLHLFHIIILIIEVGPVIKQKEVHKFLLSELIFVFMG